MRAPRETRRSSRRSWTPDMGKRSSVEEGRQVKCLTSDAGHVWMSSYDRLPPRVRQRLALSRHNICAACMEIEAHKLASRRRERQPSIAVYFAVIEAIERELDN
jgi:hypothetical protein